MKRALILGIGGQDGSYLAEVLLEQGYEVHGLYRRSSVDNLWRIKGIRDRVTLHKGDLLDFHSLTRAIQKSDPDEVYNEADQDDVGWSFACPSYSDSVTWFGARHAINALWEVKPSARFFQPLSATMFGYTPPPQHERSLTYPQSPYATAKDSLFDWIRCRREEQFVCTAIMFNHESPKRGPDYLLQTICRQVVEVVQGKRSAIRLGGDPDQRVDVGWSREYMQGAVKIMQLDEPDDFCMGTGEAPTIREWVDAALEATGFRMGSRMDYVLERDESYPARPGKPETLIADCSKLKVAIGWDPLCRKDYIVKALVESWKEKLK